MSQAEKATNSANKPTLPQSLQEVSVGKRVHADDIKIIGGKNYDSRQPIPVKYQSARQRFLNARQNFWVPNDIPMGEDKQQWAQGVLNEAEMHMFTTNISYLTASDNIVPDNLDNAILERITANEMRQYLRWQIGEEANHIESYQFILESLGLDEKGQGQIFGLYQETPALTDKLNWNINFTNKVATADTELGSEEDNRNLLEDLVSYYIFEHLFFPLGFSQIFALARQGKLRNTAQQYQYIWRDESLHSQNGLWLIQQIITENPPLWDDKMRERTRGIINEAVALETAYAHTTMPDGGIVGLSVWTYIDYARFMGNQACQNLGVAILFPQVKQHPMPWISEYELNRETNFFEGRVQEYRTGAGLSWD